MDAVVNPLYAKYSAMDLQAVAGDKQAMEMGKRLYMTYCAVSYTHLDVYKRQEVFASRMFSVGVGVRYDAPFFCPPTQAGFAGLLRPSD